MRPSLTTILLLTALSTAAPLQRRQSGPVLADTTFDDISISGGTAGNAEEEALAVFSALNLNDLANVDPADIEFLGAVNDVANDAETDAFNPAIEAASGEEATALQVGTPCIHIHPHPHIHTLFTLWLKGTLANNVISRTAKSKTKS